MNEIQRISRLMMHLCDAVDDTPTTIETIALLLGYHNYEDELLQDIEAFYNYIKELRGIERL